MHIFRLLHKFMLYFNNISLKVIKITEGGWYKWHDVSYSGTRVEIQKLKNIYNVRREI